MLQEKEFGITYSENTLAALYMQLMRIKLIEIGLIISHAILAYRKAFNSEKNLTHLNMQKGFDRNGIKEEL